jgi:hypothetical protein
MTMLTRLLREPLLHFAVLGGIFFLAFAMLDDSDQVPADVIVVSPERIDQLAEGFRAVWKRSPTPTELDGLIDDDIREEVYYREALALGLDRNDAMVRRRLRQKMEFLGTTGANLLRPADGELEAYFAANQETYRPPPRLAFEQIFFGESPDQAMIAAALEALSDVATDPAAFGQRTLLPPQLALSVPTAIDGVFGQGFFSRLAEIAPDTWAGPVQSGYGAHLVRILEREPARMPSLDAVQDAVLRDWREAKAKEIRDLHYAKLRAGYTVDIRRSEPAAVAE